MSTSKTGMFGFMDFLVMYKWVTPVESMPSIINIMICMALGQPMKQDQLMWDTQEGIQQFLMKIVRFAFAFFSCLFLSSGN